VPIRGLSEKLSDCLSGSFDAGGFSPSNIGVRKTQRVKYKYEQSNEASRMRPFWEVERSIVD
jgi:hypothetical protein